MRKIRKSFEQRREELRQALYRLDGALKRYKASGEVAELGTIASELRGLICREGLFIGLAQEKGFALEVYTCPAALYDCGSAGPIKPFVSWVGDSVSLECKRPWTRKISVQDWLNMPAAEIKGSRFTAERLINEIASRTGPAHYPSEISSGLSEMSKYRLGGVPSQFRTLVTFAEVLLELGRKFLASF